jgi:SpoVK/Ycf46/Vps4 family AAA+-type ATPase
MESSAKHLESDGRWEDLALPDAQVQTLRDIVATVRRGSTASSEAGVTARSAPGQGFTVLFTGPNGAAKTLAARVLGNELRLDLYRVDLAGVVSKYIGETEKNLSRVFDAAEDGGAILFFDEADALFGRRTEVRDSHDRYADIEVNYLLQRMEAYRGLAILTTNKKAAIDPAFVRRLRFIVDFPFPNDP